MTPRDASDHPDPAAIAPETATERVSAGQRGISPELTRLAELLAGSPHNLVSRGDREHVIERHLAECAELADAIEPQGRWMDLGTGGGLPGLVLALRHPAAEWVLVDATAKKIHAVTDFARELGVTNVTAVQARAESLAHDRPHRGAYAGVVCRAVAQLNVVAELARGFLAPGALLVAMKGPTWQDELDRARHALKVLRYDGVHSQRLAVADRESWLVTMRAHGAPPAGYPRRDGIPRQQPLTAPVSRETR